jgi:hypothetical protein
MTMYKIKWKNRAGEEGVYKMEFDEWCQADVVVHFLISEHDDDVWFSIDPPRDFTTDNLLQQAFESGRRVERSIAESENEPPY